MSASHDFSPELFAFIAQDMIGTIQAYEQNRNQEFNRSHCRRKKVADNKLTGMLLLPCPRLMQHLDLSRDILLFVSSSFLSGVFLPRPMLM